MELFNSSHSAEEELIPQKNISSLSSNSQPKSMKGKRQDRRAQAVEISGFQFVQQDLRVERDPHWRTVVRSHARKHVWDRRKRAALPRPPRTLLIKAHDTDPTTVSKSMPIEEGCFLEFSSPSLTSTHLSAPLSSSLTDEQARTEHRTRNSTEPRFLKSRSFQHAADRRHLHRAPHQTGTHQARGRKVPKRQRDVQEHSGSTETAFPSRWITATQMQWITPQTFLGAGRVDPFSTYPVPRTQAIDRLIDHYASVITDSRPPEPDTGFSSLRTKWLPLCMQGEMIFKSMILAAEVNTRGNMGLYPWSDYAAHLAGEVIILLNEELNKSHVAVSDMTIATVIQISGIELTFGETAKYQNHMRGIKEMVKMHGGMESLGDHLQDMIIWVNQLGGGSIRRKKKEPRLTTIVTGEIARLNRSQEESLISIPNNIVQRSSALLPEIVKVLVSVRWLAVAKDSPDVYEAASGFQDACFEVQHRLQGLQSTIGTSSIEGGLLLAVRLYVDAVLLQLIPEKIIRSDANKHLQYSLTAWRSERDLEENYDILELISTAATVGIAPTCGVVDQLGSKFDAVLLRLESLCLD